jgi:tetratricopeptide (TPR) repeat protein
LQALIGSRLKTSDFARTVTLCEQVLARDAKNTKALFRLAQAHTALKNFAKAIELLAQADAIAPDAAIKKELARVKTLQQSEVQKEKQLYSRMFS